MKILVLGGGGFIGSTIVDRLLLVGHEIRVFERPRVEPYRKFAEFERVEWIGGDFSNAHDINKAVEGMDIVLHLISTTLPKNSNDDPIYDVQSNVVATLQLLKAMVIQCVQKIVFISSGGTVYGNPLYLPIDEKHPTNPIMSYGITKLTIEKYLQMYKYLHNINPVILRVTNPYGERQRIETAQGAVGIFIHHALKDIPLEIWGDGRVSRDYIHVSDVAEAFVKAIEYSGTQTCFNISTGVGTSLNELIEMLEKVLGKSVKRHYFSGRSIDVPVNVLSNAFAQEELKWTPAISIELGIVRTVQSMTYDEPEIRTMN